MSLDITQYSSTRKQLLSDIKSSHNSTPIPKDLCGVIAQYSRVDSVFIVTSGSYSDYKINEVFTSRELAKKYIHIFADNYEDDNSRCDYNIEEYHINPPKFLKMIDENLKQYKCRLLQSGEVDNIRQTDYYEISEEEQEKDLMYIDCGWDKTKFVFLWFLAHNEEEVEEKAKAVWRRGKIKEN